jgi:hypothetical protein
MNTIVCVNCGVEIQVDKALEGQIEARLLAAERHKHAEEVANIQSEAAAAAKVTQQLALQAAQKQLAAEKELLEKQMALDLELTKKRLEMEAVTASKKLAAEQALLVQSMKADVASNELDKHAMRQQLTELTKALREATRAKDNAELEMQKQLAAEEAQIRAEAIKQADEKQRLNIAARDKTISDLQKALDDAQRKASQGSQQLQGEIMELDFEAALAQAFRDDAIQPIAKGVKGGDILQVVRTAQGATAGSLLWEIKRTKNWTDSWIPKLKQDLRNAKADVPIIISEVVPKQIEEAMGQLDGVWICKPGLAIVLGSLLRKALLDASHQRVLSENKGSSTEALYSFITSQQFSQQIESMVETYQEMTVQIQRERVAYAKLWSQREAQTQRLLLGTATIIGGMQGTIGQAAMPVIKGLELADGLTVETDEHAVNQRTLL